MPSLSVTLEDVGVGGSASRVRSTPVQVGEAVDQGMPLYYNSSDQKYYKASASALGTSQALYIAMTGASVDGFVLVAEPSNRDGESLVKLGTTLTVGQVYAVDTTAGGIIDLPSLASSAYVTTLGVAVTTALLDFKISRTDTQKA